MKGFSTAALLALACTSDAFVPRPTKPQISLQMTSSEIDLGLTPELKKVVDAFESISDDQLRYKQLLWMAQNTEETQNMPESSKTPENKVPGCLSTVFVDGTAKYSQDAGDYLINFTGDSDGLLTKGLVSLLVRYVLEWRNMPLEMFLVARTSSH